MLFAPFNPPATRALKQIGYTTHVQLSVRNGARFFPQNLAERDFLKKLNTSLFYILNLIRKMPFESGKVEKYFQKNRSAGE